mmetsp:Transcript_6834/g.15595  ORF Transcript_6834/g.15595 Transcript_6834/m.15595 type:complete len:231 (+) Transcript_6834:716-1408(+)
MKEDSMDLAMSLQVEGSRICAFFTATSISSIEQRTDSMSTSSEEKGCALASSAFITFPNSFVTILESLAFRAVSAGDDVPCSVSCCCNIMRACKAMCRGVPVVACTASLFMPRTICELVDSSKPDACVADTASRGSRRHLAVSFKSKANASWDTYCATPSSRNNAIRVASTTESSGTDIPAFIEGSPPSKANPTTLFSCSTVSVAPSMIPLRRSPRSSFVATSRVLDIAV